MNSSYKSIVTHLPYIIFPKMTNYPAALASHNSTEWSTPQDFFDKLNEKYHFTLDVAASDENHKCEHYYTKEQNGLAQPWEGVIWCNHP
jgi:phage N-6-adenine-methyltransferase